MKRLMTLVLALSILLTLLPVTHASAAGGETARRRYTVLLLDVCGSHRFTKGELTIYTASSAVSVTRAAAERFLTDMAAASGDNRVCVITYAKEARLLASFSSDMEGLKDKVGGISERDSDRNMTAALEMAKAELDKVNDPDAIKNVVICSTGMVNAGDSDLTYRYDSSTVGSNWYNTGTGIHLYKYANAAVRAADRIKESGITVYSIGLFQPFGEMPQEGLNIAEFFRITARDLASDENSFFDVDDPGELSFTFGTVAELATDQKDKITFSYFNDSECREVCFYRDTYFDTPANDSAYPASLTTMSLALAISSFGYTGNDYRDQSKYTRDLLKAIGVKEDHIGYSDDLSGRPGGDTIGAVAGWKPLGDGEETLIILGVRGGGYESEWSGNFKVGTDSRYHEGFRDGRDGVLAFLREFIAAQKITGPVKIWIAGYSRAAAVSNLVGAAIDEGARLGDGIRFTPQEDVYVFCFETPQGVIMPAAVTEEINRRYANIISVYNANDAVPRVAPSAWNFGAYGRPFLLPTLETHGEAYAGLKRAMLAYYNDMDYVRKLRAKQEEDLSEGKRDRVNPYMIDDFRMMSVNLGVVLELAYNFTQLLNLPVGDADVPVNFTVPDKNHPYTQSTYLDNLVSLLIRDGFGSRETYVSGYQESVRTLADLYLGMNGKEKAAFREIFDRKKLLLIPVAFNGLLLPARVALAAKLIEGWLKEAGVNEADAAKMLEILRDLLPVVLKFIVLHPNYTVTLMSNGESLANGHFPELCFAWLTTMDPNYGPDTHSALTDGGYRIVRINCEVDVEVVDAEGNVIARIIDDVPERTDEPACAFGVDENGQKIVFLPLTGEYEVLVTAAETGDVSVGVSEYSRQAGGYIRTVNYSDLPLERDRSLRAFLPQMSAEEEPVLCSLTDDAEKEIPPTQAFGEGDPQTVTVTVEVSHERLGRASGGGDFAVGSYVLVSAEPDRESEFLGWYREGRLISKETALRLRADESMTLTARFRGSEAICAREGHIWEGGTCAVCGARDYHVLSLILIIGGTAMLSAGIALITLSLVRGRKARRQTWTEQ